MMIENGKDETNRKKNREGQKNSLILPKDIKKSPKSILGAL